MNPVQADATIPAVTPVPPERALVAVSRLLIHTPGNRREAARRFIASAPNHGIDPALMWATWDERGLPRETCLAVCGSGRTATLFLAPPDPAKAGGSPKAEPSPNSARAERAQVVRAALTHLRGLGRARVALAQALAAPDEPWAATAFSDAGMRCVGTLLYLRRPMENPWGTPGAPELPPHFGLRSLAEIGNEAAWRPLLVDLLDRTYVGTLDCPGLCGLRETSDVLDSHLAVGKWDPRLWFVLFEGERAVGCMLLSRLPEFRSVELVYIGLSPEARGRGLGESLMRHGVRAAGGAGVEELTCAVDQGNHPAMAMYTRTGFLQFGSRSAFVAPLGEPVEESAGVVS
ncbi:MAG: GNAT family N-acetyltransferase [Phycisphaeraceae bacterium]|nr:GNAT family N-acetyltransferase [Phycisphaeraceae bacterium]